MAGRVDVNRVEGLDVIKSKMQLHFALYVIVHLCQCIIVTADIQIEIF